MIPAKIISSHALTKKAGPAATILKKSSTRLTSGSSDVRGGIGLAHRAQRHTSPAGPGRRHHILNRVTSCSPVRDQKGQDPKALIAGTNVVGSDRQLRTLYREVEEVGRAGPCTSQIADVSTSNLC